MLFMAVTKNKNDLTLKSFRGINYPPFFKEAGNIMNKSSK